MVDARPFAWFLQQQYKYGWFMWSYIVLQFNVLHNKMCHFKGCYQRSGRTGKNILRGSATAGCCRHSWPLE
jgi:hypothetical protein